MDSIEKRLRQALLLLNRPVGVIAAVAGFTLGVLLVRMLQ